MSVEIGYTTRQIRAVNTAIAQLIAGAQAATITHAGGTESYTRAQLPALQSWRTQLMREFSVTQGRMRRRVSPDFS